MNYDLLRADAQHIQPAPIQGEWQIIQFQPDFTTGEIFNIGVIFFEKRKKTPHVKLLPSLAGFRSIYGANGADNFKFLLRLLHEQLVELHELRSPSPQIIFGKRKFTSGNSPQEIISHLYKNMVTLARAKDDAEDDANGFSSLKTEELRRRVFKAAQKKMGNGWSSIFRSDPISISDNRGMRHSLDLPIWRGEDLLSAQIYGTILSAQFRSDAYRSASLSTGYVNFNQAAEIAKSAKGGLLILRPSKENTAFDEQLRAEIDNDIDKITWPYIKRKGIKIHVADSVDELANAALALL